MATNEETRLAVRAYVDYLRDLGVYDLYRRGEPSDAIETESVLEPAIASAPIPPSMPLRDVKPVPLVVTASDITPADDTPPIEAFDNPVQHKEQAAMPRPVSFDQLAPLPAERVAPAQKAEALQAIQDLIGDCTRCPLAYGGRRKIVFGDGDPNAALMFVGEGPGADEDASGLPFVGKAGQLLNNMITAMGFRREQVYIANIVKCRPPGNRTPEYVEATTCSPFLLAQIDVVQPKVIVALGGTAATYLLGVKQSLSSLRGQWYSARGAKVAVTYHPAFLLRDPRMKGEAWKDLQRVMAEMGLKAPGKQ
ncbi:MAG TPA: uracil-DNA glycosylase [Acidobacteriaceae bacterium]|nr:uracil-DNA glycosylase [Acidobacteriaceae bacterium]